MNCIACLEDPGSMEWAANIHDASSTPGGKAITRCVTPPYTPHPATLLFSFYANNKTRVDKKLEPAFTVIYAYSVDLVSRSIDI